MIPEDKDLQRLTETNASKKISKEYLSLDGLGVFIVEDDIDSKELFTFVFEQVGAEVIAAVSTNEALKVLEHYEPDILVSNIKLPDRDGCSLIGEVKAREAERGREIPAIAVTAAARDSLSIRVLNAGFKMHLSKPIEPDKLVEIVAKLTGRENLPILDKINFFGSHWRI